MDRRALFFFVAAAVSGALIAAVPDDPKNPHVADIGPALVIACVVLGLLSLLDHVSRHRRRS
jgi:hypothetical protein